MHSVTFYLLLVTGDCLAARLVLARGKSWKGFAAEMGRSTRGTPSSAPPPDPGFFGADLDPETAALIKQLQEEDINAAPVATRRERKAPETYKPPPPGVGGLAKSERPVKKDERRETRGGKDGVETTKSGVDGKPRDKKEAAEQTNGGSHRGKGIGGAGSGRQAGPTATTPSEKEKGSGRIVHPVDGNSTNAGSPGVWSETPLGGYKKPSGKEYDRFKHHVNEVWVQSTQRAGGGEHSDHVFKRFDKSGVECAFIDTGSKGEFVKGNLQPSLRSKKAVETYLERAAKSSGKQGPAGSGKKERLPRGGDDGKEKAEKDAAAEIPISKVSPDAKPPKSSRDDRAAIKPVRSEAATGEPLLGSGAGKEARGGRETRERGAGAGPAKPEKTNSAKKSGKAGRKSGESLAAVLPEPALATGGGNPSPGVRGPEDACAAPIREEEVASYDPAAIRAFAAAPAALLEKHAAYVLGFVSAHVGSIRAQITAERHAPCVRGADPGGGAARVRTNETPKMLPGGTYRLVCDRCSASIADGHRNCAECGSDYCVECCAEMRVVVPRSRLPRRKANSPRDTSAGDRDLSLGLKCPGKCVSNGDAGRGGAVSNASLAFKVRCVSVTTQRSLAVAKAMPDPLSDVDGLADRYGGGAFETRHAEANALSEWVVASDAACAERWTRLVFEGATARDLADESAARRAPDSEEWRHMLERIADAKIKEGGDVGAAEEAHAGAIRRRLAESAPKDPCASCREGDSTATASCHRVPHEHLQLWSPSSTDVDPSLLGQDAYHETLKHFQHHWKQGHPVVVRGVGAGQIGTGFWTPHKLLEEMRATHAKRTRRGRDAGVSRASKDSDFWPDKNDQFLPHSAHTTESVVLTDSADAGAEVSMSVGEFFQRTFGNGANDASGGEKIVIGGEQFDTEKYQKGLLRLRDWPGEDDFKSRAPRHTEAFSALLPFQEYTNPVDGPLNLLTALPKEWVPPDLGPKTYIGGGRLHARGDETDGATKTHQDASDLVNVLLHVGRAMGESEGRSVLEKETDGTAGTATAGTAVAGTASAGTATTSDDEKDVGAVWDVFRREDVPTLTEWLRVAWLKGELEWQGKRKEKAFHKETEKETGKEKEKDATQNDPHARQNHPIHDQASYLTARDLAKLAKDTGVSPWSFTQKTGDAVFVPAGCPHQVRNLRPCLKLAYEFVSPESVDESLSLARQLRQSGHEDKLQGRAMVMHAARLADQRLNGDHPRNFGPASAAAIAAHAGKYFPFPHSASLIAHSRLTFLFLQSAELAAAGAAPEAEEWAVEWDEHATADQTREEADDDEKRVLHGGKRARLGKRLKSEGDEKAKLEKTGKTKTLAASAADAKRAAAKARSAADAADACATTSPVSSETGDDVQDEEHDEMAMLLMGLGDATVTKGKRKKTAKPDPAGVSKKPKGGGRVATPTLPVPVNEQQQQQQHPQGTQGQGPFSHNIDFAALQQQQQAMLRAMQARGSLGGMFGGFNPAMAAAAIAAYAGGFQQQAPAPVPAPGPGPGGFDFAGNAVGTPLNERNPRLANGPSFQPNLPPQLAPSFFGGGGAQSAHAGAAPGGPGPPGFSMPGHTPPVTNPVAFPPPTPPTPSPTEQARAMLILLTQNPGVALSVIQTQPHLLQVPEVKTVYDAYVANISKPPGNPDGPGLS